MKSHHKNTENKSISAYDCTSGENKENLDQNIPTQSQKEPNKNLMYGVANNRKDIHIPIQNKRN